MRAHTIITYLACLFQLLILPSLTQQPLEQSAGPTSISTATRIIYLTFDENDLTSSGAWDTGLARRYEAQGVILPCERAGPYRGACTVENLRAEAALPAASANVIAFHGGCLGVPQGFDAFRAHYTTHHAARLTLFGGPDCSGPRVGALEVPPVVGEKEDGERGGRLRFLALPSEGLYRPMGRARSLHLRARDGLLVALDNITLIREGIAGELHHLHHRLVLSLPMPCGPSWPATSAAELQPAAAKRSLWAAGVGLLPAAVPHQPPHGGRQPAAAA